MQRLEMTFISKLKIGDRFYKKADRKKTVYTKAEHAPKVTNYYTYLHWAVADGEKYPSPFKHDSPVIFLRSTVTTLNS